MTNEQARKLLTADQIASAEAAGQAWGAMEIECWKDQHDGSFDRAPAWIAGNWCGDNPLGNPSDSEEADAYEHVIDESARGVWDDAR